MSYQYICHACGHATDSEDEYCPEGHQDWLCIDDPVKTAEGKIQTLSCIPHDCALVLSDGSSHRYNQVSYQHINNLHPEQLKSLLLEVNPAAECALMNYECDGLRRLHEGLSEAIQSRTFRPALEFLSSQNVSLPKVLFACGITDVTDSISTATLLLDKDGGASDKAVALIGELCSSVIERSIDDIRNQTLEHLVADSLAKGSTPAALLARAAVNRLQTF
ncbi:hypothetical protein [Neptuniibacter sp. QD37_11]|uniref:hypothetical protein n=1 Tax=Neptuniibacter sp. QD37_11 TaxID=3398209 RepID=UPI0039F54BCF